MRTTTKKLFIAFAAVIVIAMVIVFLNVKYAKAPTKQTPFTTYNLQPITSLFFAGDIMLSRNVASKIYESKNVDLPFAKVKDEIVKNDIAFANLESPFNTTGNHSVQNSLVFNADPNFAAGLEDTGFNILSTANNHSFDQGIRGMDSTILTLEGARIIAIGTGPECHTGKVLEKNGIKFGFLAYSYAGYNDGGKKANPQVCDANDLTKLSADIKTLKPQVDFLIVSMHAGTEYQRHPNQLQKNIAHTAIDAGADLIIGHHPHWIQDAEQYQGKWIFYSLGNFVFDQMWSQDTKEGLTVKISFENKTISKIELQPVIIEDFSIPRWANPDETKAILNKIGLTSTILLGKNK